MNTTPEAGKIRQSKKISVCIEGDYLSIYSPKDSIIAGRSGKIKLQLMEYIFCT
jgi:hypothetical protein